MSVRVLVTGGAGYIGTTLIPILLSHKFMVTVLDNLMFGGDALLPFFRDKNFEFIKGDIRDKSTVKHAVSDNDVIVHLAAIVGFPACRKNPRLAKEVNLEATRKLSSVVSKNQLLIFASTESNYGGAETVVTEETPLTPLSLYAQTKTIAEKYLLKHNSTIALRFATGFGVAPRMRVDSLVNDFVFRALTQGYIVVYEKHVRRSFIHVHDMARAVLFAISKANAMKGGVFNIGTEDLSITKEELCNHIKKQIKCFFHYAEVYSDLEKRDFRVSYQKVKKLGYNTTIGIEEGISELKTALRVIDTYIHYANV